MAFNPHKRSDTQSDVIQHGTQAAALGAFNQALLFKGAMIHFNPPRASGLRFPLGFGHWFKTGRPVFRRAVCSVNAEHFDFAEFLVFGESLIRCSLYLSAESEREQNLTRLKKWFKVIEEELNESDEFEIALRVIGKIISYTESKDKRVLLELRPEERTFLKPLIKDEKHF